MNRMKKIISVMLVAAVVFCAAPLAGLIGLDLPEFNLFGSKAEATTYTGSCGENLDWVFYDTTGELHIGGTGEMTNWAGINSVPWKSQRSLIKSIKIYDDVKNIGSNAFSNCANLESVIIGKDVESIGSNVFTSCSKLKDITVDSANTVYSSVDGILFNEEKTVLIKCPAGNPRTSYAVPDSVKKIDDFSFQSCGKLESIAIPYGVAAIGDRAFESCGKLKTVTIPDSVTIIGKNAFSFCKALENITLSKGLTAIGNYTFGYCEALEDVVIPDGVTEIEANAFIYCFELKSIIIPRSVKTVGKDAFNNASKISDVYYGGTKAEWDEISFGEGNGFLTRNTNNFVWNHVVPEETTTTAPSTTQPSTTVPSTTAPTTTQPSTTAPSTTAPTTTRPTTTVPSTTERPWYEGKCGENLTWALYTPSAGEKGELVISGTGDMPSWSSSSNTPWSHVSSYVESVTVSDGVTSIGDFAFSYLYYCKEIKLADSVKRIGKSAFSACYNLESIKIPDSVTSIGESAFGSCEQLENITIPNGVKSIGYRTFYDCLNLKSISLPDGLTDIGVSAFEYCRGLENITIPNSVTNIGDRAFFGCEKLKSIAIPYGVPSIGECVFYRCEQLENVTIPDSVTSIGESAFHDCDIPSIVIPVSVKTIGYGAFHMSGVDDVYYPGTEEEWNRIAIAGYNNTLVNADFHFNYDPDAPTTSPVTTTRPVTTTSPVTTTRPTTTRPVVSTTKPVTDNKATIQILAPSRTVINYGDSIILHAQISGDIPQGATVKWSANNSYFSYTEYESGANCKISSVLSGATTFTVTLCDADGSVISSDIQAMTSNAGLFQRIIAFFKRLFGISQTIPEFYKGIY